MTTSSNADRRATNSEPSRPRLAIRYWHAFVTAIQFLSRVPISSRLSTSESLRLAPVFFPFVGSLVGGVTVGCIVLASLAWPVWIAVLLALLIEALLTGALHEDGLADFCDGFGGGWQREDVLQILKDSRIGTYGTVGLVLAMSLRAICMMTVVDRYGAEHWLQWVSAIVAASAVARWMIVLTMVVVPPIIERESLSKDIASQMSWRLFAASGFGAIPPIVVFTYLLPINAALAIGLIGFACLCLVRLVRRKLRGITGDCLGCIGYVCQVMFLLGAAARIS